MSNGRNTSRKKICGACQKAYKQGYPIYHIHKKTYCEMCGFIAVNSCQLDVDHIDGNKMNGELSNLQTLCANCHRLKTHNAQDYL